MIVPAHSPPQMSKRHRSKKFTLTKIDPAKLFSKPQAVSQYATDSGAAVTTTVNPVYDSQEMPCEGPDTFDADPSNFKEEYLGDEDNEEEVARAYYVARVCSFTFSSMCWDLRLSVVRTTHSRL